MIDIQKWQALQMKVLIFPDLYVFITNLCHVGNLMHFDLNPIPPCEKLEICQCPLTRHPLLAVQKCPSFPFSNAPFEQLQ